SAGTGAAGGEEAAGAPLLRLRRSSPLQLRQSRRLRTLERLRRAYAAHARTIRMSPLIEVARSSAVGPSPPGGASPTSSSDVVSPLIVLASLKTRVPRRMP